MTDILTAQDVAVLVNTTVPTLNTWYKWKALNPENSIAKLLPEYTRQGNRRTRYWRPEDIDKILEFKSKILKGRAGFLGQVTQKYAKHKKEEPNENET